MKPIVPLGRHALWPFNLRHGGVKIVARMAEYGVYMVKF